MKGIVVMSYNYLNLPEKISKGLQQSLGYIYDATGRKHSQEVYNEAGLVTKKSDYEGEFFYENDTLKFISHDEGRAVMSGSLPEYQYHLKDHLGNVRMTFTTKPESEVFKATLETGTQPQETNTFRNYHRVDWDLFDQTDAAGTVYTYSQLLHGGNNSQVGLAKSFSVMPGDTIKAEVFAKYQNLTSSTSGLSAFATALTDAFGLNSTMVGDPGSAYDALDSYGTLIAGGYNHSDDINAPKAFLNILLFDKDYNFVDAAYKQIGNGDIQTGTVKAPHGLLFTDKIVTQAGYAFVFLSNENPTQVDVYFDDLKITHAKSPVIQMDDYYPFGLTFNSYQRENSVKNKFKFQGQEHIDDLDLGWDSFKWRNHQPDIGRFFNVDPLAEKYYYNSPYAFSENKVVVHRELEGLEAEYLFKQEAKKVENVVMSVVNKTIEGAQSVVGAIGDGIKQAWNSLSPGKDRGGSTWTSKEHGGDQRQVSDGQSDGGGIVDPLIGPTLRSAPANSIMDGVAQGIEMVTTIESKFHPIEKMIAGDNLKVGDSVQVNTDQKPGTVYPGAHGREYKQIEPYRAVVIKADTVNVP